MDEIDPAARPCRRFTAAEKLSHLEAYDALEKRSAEQVELDRARKRIARLETVLGRSRATHYRRSQAPVPGPPAPRPAPVDALSETERQHILAVLRSELIATAPNQVWSWDIEKLAVRPGACTTSCS